MPIQTLQTTTNFVVKYDDSNSEAQGMAQAIANVCENEFTVLTGWFNIALGAGFGVNDRITVTVQSISKGGANNGGYQSGGNTTINVNFLPASFTASQANSIAPMMFVNEFVEVLMSFNDQKSGVTTWVANHSDGEGLSQFCGILRFPSAIISPTVPGRTTGSRAAAPTGSTTTNRRTATPSASAACCCSCSISTRSSASRRRRSSRTAAPPPPRPTPISRATSPTRSASSCI